jgi:outer membrane protein OmpA-like peptidoglycan-associated protein
MKSHLPLLLLAPLLLIGCAAKQNLIVLTPDNSGRAGALELNNAAGKAVIEEGGKAVTLASRQSRPEQASLSEAERTSLFGEALAVQPLPPVSYALTFEFGADALTPASQETIPKILAAIKERDSLDIKVIGHTDRVGEEAFNHALGLERAVVIRDILIAQGVEAGAISALSYGEGDPLVVTDDNVPEPQNRRVEVVVR